MELEVLEHEFNAAPFPIMALAETITGRWKQHLGRNVKVMALDFEGTNLKWIVDMPSWNGCAQAMFDRVNEDRSFFLAVEREVIRNSNALLNYVEPWKTTDFSTLPNAQLSELYSDFLSKLRDTFEYGVLLVILDFTPAKLTQKLKGIADARFGEKANKAFTTLTKNVEELTFQKREELDFLRILTLPESRRKAEIKKHAEEYGFLSYGYKGPLLWTEKYFTEMAAEAEKQKLDPLKKLGQYEEEKARTKKEILQLEKKLTGEEREWFAIGRKLVFLKPWRKDMQVRGYPIVEKLLRETAKRLKIPLEATRYLTEEEMKAALKEGKADLALLLERKKRCFVFVENGKSAAYSGKEADCLAKKVKKEETPDVSELRGTPATIGIVKGRARIVNTAEDMAKMRRGDVLLSVATNPFLLPAIKKASAIVTDQGGLTCHAAIVSREFNIPCIVGTQYATRVFRDGDVIEVNATRGIVRKL